MKKTLLALAFCLIAFQLAFAQTTPQPVIRVTLLGTGVPGTDTSRARAGLLVEAGSERMLFDCGQGVYQRLIQSGGSLADPTDPNTAVDKLFFSHLHSDHITDISSLYTLGWFTRLAAPLRVWGPGPGPNGPIGTSAMMPLLRLAFDADIDIRSTGFKNPKYRLPITGVLPIAKDISEGVVYSHNGVTVTAFLVDHQPVRPAYGYRIDYNGKSVVFSGDTRPSDNLVKFSTGVDMLIHEVYGVPREVAPPLYEYHTSPEDAAGIFNATKPGLAVYTHLAISPGSSVEDVVNRTRAAGYTGPLQVGADLMRIDVMPNGVSVTQPPASLAPVPASESAVHEEH